MRYKMKQINDSNGNKVLVNDREDRAYIPYQMITNLSMGVTRSITNIRMAVKTCPIVNGVVDYSEQALDLKLQEISVPLEYLSTFSPDEVKAVEKLLRGGYEMGIENIMKPKHATDSEPELCL
jgi:hypothetical protein